MPKFDDDSDEDQSEKQRVRIRQRRAVYSEVLKAPNGKLSMTHITLEPRGQAGVPLPVQANEVIGFCWKEETGVGVALQVQRRAACSSAASSPAATARRTPSRCRGELRREA